MSMSSWYTDFTSKVGDLQTKVKSAIPIDKKLLEKLTLTTPELTAERQRIDEEEKHKEKVKDSLAGMLPWETRDVEREILVEECREAILALSSKEESFLGPYAMPAMADDGNGDEKVEPKPSEESLEKLAKLEPLPPLLADFDLDSHVGLIQRLLQVDKRLVDRQSTLSGAGQREKTFWRNYFFHCAFTRYEAGLSIDEIWSDQPLPPSREVSVLGAGEAESSAEEMTITFEREDADSVNATGASTTSDRPPVFAFNSTIATELAQSDGEEGGAKGMATPTSVDAGDYDVIDDSDDGLNSEMDELEAEIARELED